MVGCEQFEYMLSSSTTLEITEADKYTGKLLEQAINFDNMDHESKINGSNGWYH